MPNNSFLKTGLLVLLFTQSLSAKIDVATLNCYLYFSPANAESTRMDREPISPENYARKTENLASLIVKAEVEFVGLQEIGSKIEADDLAAALTTATGSKWRAYFTQGKDTYTGEDIAVLLKERAGIRVVSYGRVPELEKDLSKHLVVSVDADGRRYKIAVVHLIRPIGPEGMSKHARQLDALRQWISVGSSDVMVLGDFNDVGKDLLELKSANDSLGWPATHIGNKALDHLYGSRDFSNPRLIRPPYATRPNDLQRSLWTDHYLLAATAP